MEPSTLRLSTPSPSPELFTSWYLNSSPNSPEDSSINQQLRSASPISDPPLAVTKSAQKKKNSKAKKEGNGMSQKELAKRLIPAVELDILLHPSRSPERAKHHSWTPDLGLPTAREQEDKLNLPVL